MQNGTNITYILQVRIASDGWRLDVVFRTYGQYVTTTMLQNFLRSSMSSIILVVLRLVLVSHGAEINNKNRKKNKEIF
jgi:hypothetical protein